MQFNRPTMIYNHFCSYYINFDKSHCVLWTLYLCSDFSQNNLSGQIPEFLANLTNLRELWVDFVFYRCYTCLLRLYFLNDITFLVGREHINLCILVITRLYWEMHSRNLENNNLTGTVTAILRNNKNLSIRLILLNNIDILTTVLS